MEFILFLEQETGNEILAEGLEPERLRTIGSIYASFYEGAHE